MRLGVISRLSLSRKGLSALLASSKRCSIVLELPSIPEDVEVLRKAQAEVLLFHTNGGAGDLEVVSRLRNLAPEIKMLLLSDSADEEMEFQAIRAGGCGCVSNASDLNTLLKAIGVVGRGEIWVSRRVASRLIKNLAQSETREDATPNGLTAREWKVLGLLASGCRNKEIANRLAVSENTVKTHLYTIYRKIHVDCRLAATLYYFQNVKVDGEPSPRSAARRAKPKAPKAKDDLPSDPEGNSPPE
jgi:DNA-binding NarL/FixJ family response regulator